MRIVLDLDDFSDADTCRKELEELNEYFDDFKISMFAVPYKTSRATIEEFRSLGCEFLPHGFEHTHLEMDTMSYDEVSAKLRPVDEAVDSGLYGRVFKAPYWRYSWASYRALVDHGYTIAVSREQVRHPAHGIPVYEYDLELDEDWVGSALETVRLHGHVTPYRNSLEVWYQDLIAKLPKDTEFLTVSERVAELGGAAIPAIQGTSGSAKQTLLTEAPTEHTEIPTPDRVATPYETLDQVESLIRERVPGAYMRFGDGDLNLAYGENDMMQVPNQHLQQEMREAFSVAGEES